MQKPDPDSPKFTINEQKLLKHIAVNAKIPDTKLAEKLGLSPQAIFKIREKLERLGVIEGYQPILNFGKVGIKALSLLIIDLKDSVWDEYSDDEISEKLRKIPYVINAYRVVEPGTSHIILMGFRDADHRETYLNKMQTKYRNEIDVKNLFNFPVKGIISQSPLGLLYEIMDKKEFSIPEFFLGKKI